MGKKEINPETLIEEYKFYRLCDIDFDATLHTLKVLQRYKRQDVRFPLLRDITITYARPFSKNMGKVKSYHRLNAEEYVPVESMKLHTYLMELRNQSFAHTDLPYRNPKVVNWSSSGIKCFPMSFKGYQLEELDKKTDDLLILVTGIRFKLKQSLMLIEDEFS